MGCTFLMVLMVSFRDTGNLRKIPVGSRKSITIHWSPSFSHSSCIPYFPGGMVTASHLPSAPLLLTGTPPPHTHTYRKQVNMSTINRRLQYTYKCNERSCAFNLHLCSYAHRCSIKMDRKALHLRAKMEVFQNSNSLFSQQTLRQRRESWKRQVPLHHISFCHEGQVSRGDINDPAWPPGPSMMNWMPLYSY